MHTSIELIDKALQGGDTQRELSRKLGMSSSTLSVARTRKRLSPTAAGTLAAHIGADAVLWTAIAALEAEPKSKQRDTLLERLIAKLDGAKEDVRNFYLAHIAARMTPRIKPKMSKPMGNA